MENAAIETVAENIYVVPEINLAKLTDVIAKMNKKAAKLGCEPVALSVEFLEVKWLIVHKKGKEHGYEWVSKEKLANLPAGYVNVNESMGFYSVKVSGKYPHYNGWKFVASMEAIVTKDEQVENLIKTVPGESCPTDFSLKIGVCEHCNQKRNRKKNFVLAHEAGSYKCVGSSCIADFLGGKSPEAYAAQAEWLMAIDEACSDCEEYLGGGSIGAKGEDIESYLKVVSWVIDTNGWRSVSSCEFGGIPTATWASRILNPHPLDSADLKDVQDKYYAKSAEESAKHEAIAKAAIEYYSALSDAEVENNNFLHNCRLIAKCEWVGNKNLGIAAWLVAGYLKHVEKLKEEERKAKLPASVHVGVVGKRESFKVECLAVYKSEGQYGTTGIHKLITAEGSVLIWFASEGTDWLSVGSKYEVKATVKSHGEYKGQKQTTVVRVSVEHELDANGEVIESIELSEGRIAHCDSPSVPKKLFSKLAKVTKAADEQAIKETICEIIDLVKCDEVKIHWGGKTVSKTEAKAYVLSYESELVPAKNW